MKVITIFLLLAVSLAASTKVQKKNDEPLVHEYLKLTFWLLFGVVVGVFFEAKMKIKELVTPLYQRGLSGIKIAFGVYAAFMFASYVTNFL